MEQHDAERAAAERTAPQAEPPYKCPNCGKPFSLHNGHTLFVKPVDLVQMSFTGCSLACCWKLAGH